MLLNVSCHNERFRLTKISKVLLLLIVVSVVLFSCSPTYKYKEDLLSNDVASICKACYELGKAKDTSAVKLLLTRILDPRISHDLRFKGMSVAQCRTAALTKISKINVLRKGNEYMPDTAAVYFYLEWAVKKGHLKQKDEVNIYYTK
jgi:cell division protein FtsL